MGTTAAKANVGTGCSTDYVVIPNGQALSPMYPMRTVMLGNDRFCGRDLNPMAGAGGRTLNTMKFTFTFNPVSVCSSVTPFILTVVTDSTEEFDGDTNTVKADMDEASGGPLGTAGFQLRYALQPCTN